MASKVFERKKKEELPVLAICYDFDKTLSPDDMQAQGYIQSVGYDTEKFWIESNGLAETNDMDQNLAYMYKMVTEAEGHLVFTRETLAEYGSKVVLFPGVEGWFERIRKYGIEHNVIVEHYIISSGLKEMIEGTTIAQSRAFEKIYASSFYFNERGVAKWPAQVVNYTNKTQFLFRIEKGVLDVNDPGVNEYFRPEEIRIPFRNMIYIGDSDTDIPCMKLVNSYGGHSIGVYDAKTEDKRKVYKMIK
ncbi:HAD family hydrolase, partial [Phascolarctobacterium sp.]